MEKKSKAEKENIAFQADSQLARVKAAFILEGHSLSEATIHRCQQLIENKITIDEAIAQVKQGHR